MAHTHDVYDTGKRFEINGISRFIKETSETKLVLVQGDHKSEVVTFEMPRYIDGHDMLLCNKIRVHYINIETKTDNTSADIYEVTDLKLCEDCGEEETLLFTWTIEAQATKYFGSLSFLVKFECTEGDNILYQWNTARYVNINVLNGIDNSEAFVDKYSNVLEEWYNKLMGESETVANLVETVGQQLEDCEQATTNATKATNSCAEATENCISATEDAEAVRAEVEAGGFIESLKEINKGKTFKTWVGTEAEYNEQTNNGTKYEQNCLYITDDAPIGDYIVEQGEKDGWTYRKWKSGKCELSATDVRNLEFSDSNQQGSIYRSNQIYADLPFLVYKCRAFFDCTDVNVWASAGPTPNPTSAAVYFLWRGFPYELIEYRTHIYVVGRWK